MPAGPTALPTDRGQLGEIMFERDETLGAIVKVVKIAGSRVAVLQ